ncbi:MAG: sigma 54-interacting transcriptional regulator [Myxococcota bacterium]
MGKPEPGSTRVLKDGRPIAQRLRGMRLLLRLPGGVEDAYEFSQPSLRIGAHPANDLVIPEQGVSRIHCEITADEHGFRLRDLGSTNGTFVDGLRANDIYLRSQAHVAIGLAELVFEPAAKDEEIPLSDRQEFGGLVGTSVAMRALFSTLETVAGTEATVLIQGESGTGKELIAEAIHGASPRAQGPFVVFDCGAVSANLLESELFGHERGAFTGAAQAHEGCLEAADGGTLFLDEIGELPLELQPKLLRAVERKEVRRLGATSTKKVDVRIVAATNRDLAAEVNRGAFREDLYYRLAVVRLTSPPLRERTEDIPLLVEHFLRGLLRTEAEAQQALHGIRTEVWARLAEQPWRGNVRELKNLVERRLALGDAVDRELATPVLPPPVEASSGLELRFSIDPRRGLIEQRNELLARFERTYLTDLIARHSNNISRAAAAAGIDRMYFKRLLKKYEGE